MTNTDHTGQEYLVLADKNNNTVIVNHYPISRKSVKVLLFMENKQ